MRQRPFAGLGSLLFPADAFVAAALSVQLSSEGGESMTFDEILAQVVELRQGRVSYRALKRRFALDDEYLEDLKAEIIKTKQLAIDEAGEVLVWTGGITQPLSPKTSDLGLRTLLDSRLQPLDL